MINEENKKKFKITKAELARLKKESERREREKICDRALLTIIRMQVAFGIGEDIENPFNLLLALSVGLYIEKGSVYQLDELPEVLAQVRREVSCDQAKEFLWVWDSVLSKAVDWYEGNRHIPNEKLIVLKTDPVDIPPKTHSRPITPMVSDNIVTD